MPHHQFAWAASAIELDAETEEDWEPSKHDLVVALSQPTVRSTQYLSHSCVYCAPCIHTHMTGCVALHCRVQFVTLFAESMSCIPGFLYAACRPQPLALRCDTRAQLRNDTGFPQNTSRFYVGRLSFQPHFVGRICTAPRVSFFG